MRGKLLTLGFVVLATLAGLMAGSETCFWKSERVDGMNKLCFYDCPSGEYSKTVKSYQLCPLSVKRD